MHKKETINPTTPTTPPIELAYRTLAERTRGGPLGAMSRVIAERPALMGALGGVATVVIAGVARPAGVASAPLIAAALSAIVIATWTTLVWATRGLFEQLTVEQVEVVRELILDGARFEWATLGEEALIIEGASLAVHAAPGALDAPGERPWPVWLIVTGEGDGRWVLESKLMAREARELPEADPRLFEARDEVLPTHVASPLLRRALEAPRA